MMNQLCLRCNLPCVIVSSTFWSWHVNLPLSFHCVRILNCLWKQIKILLKSSLFLIWYSIVNTVHWDFLSSWCSGCWGSYHHVSTNWCQGLFKGSTWKVHYQVWVIYFSILSVWIRIANRVFVISAVAVINNGFLSSTSRRNLSYLSTTANL